MHVEILVQIRTRTVGEDLDNGVLDVEDFKYLCLGELDVILHFTKLFQEGLALSYSEVRWSDA